MDYPTLPVAMYHRSAVSPEFGLSLQAERRQYRTMCPPWKKGRILKIQLHRFFGGCCRRTHFETEVPFAPSRPPSLSGSHWFEKCADAVHGGVGMRRTPLQLRSPSCLASPWVCCCSVLPIPTVRLGRIIAQMCAMAPWRARWLNVGLGPTCCQSSLAPCCGRLTGNRWGLVSTCHRHRPIDCSPAPTPCPASALASTLL